MSKSVRKRSAAPYAAGSWALHCGSERPRKLSDALIHHNIKEKLGG
jgi:hypothetical protein